MARMTIKSYATKHKLSIFNVVKMIKSGALKSEVVEENGKEVTFIVDEDNLTPREDHESEQGVSQESTLAEKVSRLEKDVAILKRELDALKMSMGIQA